MFVLIGYVIAILSVFGGFALAGGHLAALLQPVELLMIGGAAVGAFIAANGGRPLKAIMRSLPSIFKSEKYDKGTSLELFGLLYGLLAKVRKEGMMSIEGDIENPENSRFFQNYPRISGDHHLADFICDYFRLMISGTLNPHEMENLMDLELETHHDEGHVPISAVQRMADALPAFGIVAAVMGVVHTMESVGLPPAELGKLIAQALVGTFLGILLAYAFVAPIAQRLEYRLSESTRMLFAIKATLLASVSGYAPQIAVEFGRKALSSHERPSFSELEDFIKQNKSSS
jgi:chemotaxis protein MotA